MSNGKRQTGWFGIAGMLAAALIIVGFLVAGNIFLARGKLTVQVMDAPVELENLWITIDWVRIQGENGWVNLTLKENGEFDLLTLQNSADTLTEDMIPTGNYSMIEMHVSAAYAVNTTSPERIELHVPSDVIKVLLNPHMELESSDEKTVLIDLEPYDISSIAISESLNLRPVVKAIVG